MQPYEPADGQLLTLQLRPLRAARAFLDPELQSGAITAERAFEALEGTYRAPGQANSYFRGDTRCRPT
jgi:hypothetical protein